MPLTMVDPSMLHQSMLDSFIGFGIILQIPKDFPLLCAVVVECKLTSLKYPSEDILFFLTHSGIPVLFTLLCVESYIIINPVM